MWLIFTSGAGKEEVGLAVGEAVVDEIEEVAISRLSVWQKGRKEGGGRGKELHVGKSLVLWYHVNFMILVFLPY